MFFDCSDFPIASQFIRSGWTRLYFLAGGPRDAVKHGIVRGYHADHALLPPRIELGMAVRDFGRYEAYSLQTGCADLPGLAAALHEAANVFARGFTIVIYGPPEAITGLARETAAYLMHSLPEMWARREDSNYPKRPSYDLKTDFPDNATLCMGEALCLTECATCGIVRLSHVRRR